EVPPAPAPAAAAPPMATGNLPHPGTWTESTVEVSLEERAQASVAAQTEGEGVVFEEVFDAESRPAAAPALTPMAPDVFSRFEPEFAAASRTTTPEAPPAPAF